MKKVLIVEDEKFIGELYSRALIDGGYEVVIVETGDEGLTLALNGEFDIILLDIMVPGLLGIDFLKKIKLEHPEIKSKIIITTNLENSEDTRKSIEKDADGYLIKAEVSPSELVTFLDQVEI
ncbi:hypothetical protein A3F37_02825 [Candidatus Saccharibacteria bacterium RIFCSPHIGHO2_12_FULL_41_12]|nr:MAG: hypothetical protein A3F37_02825 [Candidatus Saccharibacteria bacterium RIFCSPHIGHO2_12_FULL_41_12]